ncbi:hypothetical protein LPTSP4_19850 [Leptospira ryugenii]|uniref:Uncharacterized protein n=1 Tax=Leptospira ryugenii TaxID=1917863 RepID=A0A2P2E0P4_9LEPT|nr:hypothetical protein [Leptospira ryugenii]GBF50460.1 hypothetical protein LPTSP4_19850 [Leptospira ryugenii]
MKETLRELSKLGTKGFITGIAFAFGIYTFDIFAITITGTINTFFSGQVIKANDLNTNFSSLRTAIESIPDFTKNGVNAVFAGGGLMLNTSTLANSSTLSVNGRISSRNLGLYCGVTSSTTGNAGGFTGLRSACATACGNTNAHVCTAHEMSLTRQQGISVAEPSWFSAYGYWLGTVSLNVYDCNGWTSASAAQGGTANESGGVTWKTCDTSNPVACCL